MVTIKNNIFILILALSLTACAGDYSKKVLSLQNKDKRLSCDEIALEINETEFYLSDAQNNKSLGVGDVVMPLSYIATYMDANDAESAANKRIDYLNKVSSIRKCDEPFAPRVAENPPRSNLYATSDYYSKVSYGDNQHYYHHRPVPDYMTELIMW